MLIDIEYFTSWTEVFTLKELTDSIILDFLEGIFIRFGIPRIIISDNAKTFLGTKIIDWALNLGIYLKNFSKYYPQGNGLIESINKNLIRIMKQTMNINQI